MSFVEFFKVYWERTNRDYCNEAVQWVGRHINWNSRKAMKARNNGQKYISKLQRKILIFLQYLFLVLGIVLWLFNDAIPYLALGVVIFLFISSYEGSDFSIIKIAFLYVLLVRESVYSRALYQCFMGNFDVNAIKRAFEKKENVFVYPCALFELRPKVKFDILVKRETVAKVVFWPNCVVLKTKNEKIKIKEEYESCEELLSVIGKILKEALAKNSDCIH
jgi:hypothetical protein